MNEELEKEELPKKDLNETEKDLQILLKDAGVDEIGEKLLKEVENAYQIYINSLIANKEINSKDETINKNENFSISFNNTKIQNNIIFKGKKLA